MVKSKIEGNYVYMCPKCKQSVHILDNAGTDLEAVPLDMPNGWFHMKCYKQLIGVINRWLSQ